MRKARVLFLLLLLLVAGAYLGLYGLHSGWFSASTGPDPMAEPAMQGSSETTTAAARPSFDIVRAEPDGSVIMAGRAEPRWTVSVESGGKEVGRAVADENGDWVIEPARKLEKGEHALELKSQNPGGERTLFSKQRLALSLSDPRKDQPLVALTEEGKSTRVLQMPPPAAEEPTKITEPPAATGNPAVEAAMAGVPVLAPDRTAAPALDPPSDLGTRVGFASVDYEEAGEKSMLHMSGQAAPGMRVMLYVDNKFQGAATTDATGSWSYSGNKALTGGGHTLRADLVEKDATRVLGRAEVKFERSAPAAVALAGEDGDKTASAYDAPGAGLPGQRSDANTASEETEAVGSERKSAVIVVRSGDTLWQIAQRHYGSGAKYTQIFKSNRKQIRDPNWIYPSQKFELPQ